MRLRKYWYVAIFLSLVAVAGVLLGVSTVSGKKPAEFKLALVYSSDTWGSIAPCG